MASTAVPHAAPRPAATDDGVRCPATAQPTTAPMPAATAGGDDDRGARADQSQCGEGADECPRADAHDRGHCGGHGAEYPTALRVNRMRGPFGSATDGSGVTNTLRSRPIAEMSHPLVAQYSSTRCVGERVVAVEADSWDVYFPAPLSLSLVANTFAHNGMQRELGTLLDLHDGQVDAIAADLRLFAPDRRLDVTAIAHHSVPGQAHDAPPRARLRVPHRRSTRAPTSGCRSHARSSPPPPPGRGSATRRGCARRPPRRWASGGIPCPRTRPRARPTRCAWWACRARCTSPAADRASATATSARTSRSWRPTTASRPEYSLRLGDLRGGPAVRVAQLGLDHDHRAPDLEGARHRLDVPAAHTAQEVRRRADRGRARGAPGRFRNAQSPPAASARPISAPPCSIPPAVQRSACHCQPQPHLARGRRRPRWRRAAR